MGSGLSWRALEFQLLTCHILCMVSCAVSPLAENATLEVVGKRAGSGRSAPPPPPIAGSGAGSRQTANPGAASGTTSGEKERRRGRGRSGEDLSRNISLVLENLLKNYESSQLPNHGKGEPTVIKTNILIRSMGPVSELDMEYSMDCYFRQYWRDSRLSFHGLNKSLSLSIKMLERIWRPDTYFYNGKQSYVHTITVPNKLLRINQDGDILYSMRLTIKAKCPMELHNFPMDRQSCPLILGSYAYPSRQLVYQWQSGNSVSFESGMALSQFDLMGSPQRNLTIKRREGEFSLLQVNFNLRRHTGYFLIQVYVPCILIVVLSWVSFWIHREATSDRVGLCITTVLTLSTISLDSRTDLPKVRYATALDWFLLMSFFYCIATLLEFAGVHYFTKNFLNLAETWFRYLATFSNEVKEQRIFALIFNTKDGKILKQVGSGEIPVDEEEWEDIEESVGFGNADPQDIELVHKTGRRRSSLICPIYNDPSLGNSPKRLSFSQCGNAGRCQAKVHTSHITMERQTQTETRVPRWQQLYYCLVGDERYRREREREAWRGALNKRVNSVSYIDRAARILFPTTFALLNFAYWMLYFKYQPPFDWKQIPGL